MIRRRNKKEMHPDRNALIVKLYKEGKSFGRIAKELGVSIGIVAGVTYRANRRDKKWAIKANP
jgi:transposase